MSTRKQSSYPPDWPGGRPWPQVRDEPNAPWERARTDAAFRGVFVRIEALERKERAQRRAQWLLAGMLALVLFAVALTFWGC